MALNGSFSFEAVTAGLSFSEVLLLCGSDVLRQPLTEALLEVLALLPEDLQILALLPQLPGRRLAEPAAPTHRFRLVFTVPRPPLWAELRFAALHLGTATAQEEWFKALSKVHFLEAMVEISENRERPCSLPSGMINAPQMPCEESQVTTVSLGSCTTKCLAPLEPSEETLHCFAGFWSPSFFHCREVQEAAPCAVPTGISNAAENPCQGLQGATLSPGSFCFPQCQVGSATESVLACLAGQLEPSTFSCVSQECFAPNVTFGATPSCLEGFQIASGRQCTALCQPGFRPTANLSCYSGQLVPSRFLCLNVSMGEGSADDFWGSTGETRLQTSRSSSMPMTTTEVADPGVATASFWDFIGDETFLWALAIGGGALALCLLLLALGCCFKRRQKHRAASAKEQVAWDSAAEEISRQNSVFESQERSPKRKNSKTSRASSKASSEGSPSKTTQGVKELGSIDRLEGPEELKEILRLMAGEEEEKAPQVPEDLQNLELEDNEDNEDNKDAPLEVSDGAEMEPELLRLVIDAAAEVERPPQPKASKDAVFEAMDRELGEAVTAAAVAAPLQSRSRSLIAQEPPRRPSPKRT